MDGFEPTLPEDKQIYSLSHLTVCAASPCKGINIVWSGWQDLNLRPPASKAGRLPG